MTKYFNKISEKFKRVELRKKSTNSENILWQYLRDKKMRGVKFKRQYSIDKYVIDFYAPKFKLAIELDGAIHEFNKEYDAQREIFIKEAGIAFLRFNNEAVEKNIIEVLHIISNTIQNLEITSKSTLPPASSP